MKPAVKSFSRPGRRTLAVAAVLLAAAVVLRAPVSLITVFLPPGLQLKSVEGSLWNGQAAAVGVGGLLVQERLVWRFKPQALLGAKLEWAISGQLAEQSSRLNLAVRPGGIDVSDVSVFLPLEPLAALHPKLKPAQLGARLHATAKTLAGLWNGKSATTGTLLVDQLSTPLVPQGALGSYTLEFDATAGKGSWRIAPVAGNLLALGQGDFDASQAKLHGQLTLTPQAPMPGLMPVLSSLPKVGEGFQLAF